MIANSFHDVFWPTLWATLVGALVGVAGGIRVGLALDSLRRKREEAAGREEERERIEHVLRVVKKSVDDNASGLRELQDVMRGDRALVGLSVLGDERGDVLPFDPELVRALGMLPMEYLYFYYYRQRAVDNIVASGGTRGEQVAALNAALWPALRERIEADDLEGAKQAWERAMHARDESYFARERGEEVGEDPDPEADEPPEMFEGEGYEGRKRRSPSF